MGIYGVLTFDGRSLLMDVINFRWLFSKYPPSRAFDALGIYMYICIVSIQDHGSEFLVLVQQATGREDSCRYPLVQGKAHACRAWSRSLNILNSNGPRCEHLKFEAHMHPENPFLFSAGSGRHRPSELSQRKAPPGIKIKPTIRISNALYCAVHKTDLQYDQYV